jgi:hypothetical protein
MFVLARTAWASSVLTATAFAISTVACSHARIGSGPALDPLVDSRHGDACTALTDGQHLLHAGDGEVTVARTCSNGATVGFCDVEITRDEQRLSLDRCRSVERQIIMNGNLRFHGTLGVRVGGVMSRYEVGTLRVSGTVQIMPGFKIAAWLSGPFEPGPADRFAVIIADKVEFDVPITRIATEEGGSFRVEATDEEVVLTDYRPPPGGWTYHPIRQMPAAAFPH